MDDTARPIDASERLMLLDVLRGFALPGVFISNVFVWFSGLVLLPKAVNDAAMAEPLTAAVTYFYNVFISGKFITLFSFLFGLGFSVQMGRAQARGASVVPVYLRRLGAMLLLGCAHMVLLWSGDILMMYASIGFLLLLFRNRSDRFVLISSGVLLLAGAVGVPVLLKLLSDAKAAQAPQAFNDEVMAAYAQGTYLDIVRTNVRFWAEHTLKPILAGHTGVLLSRFLLGLVAGRQRVFHDVAAHRRLFRHLLGWGLAVGLLFNGGATLVSALVRRGSIDANAGWLVLLRGVSELGFTGLTAFYVAAIALLFQRPAWRRVLAVLAAPGRMALTNYLSQSLLAILCYDGIGLGLIGQSSRLTNVLLPLGLYCVQVAWSHAWLARFRFGPAEWVWRSLTYGKPQPMRLQPEAATPAPSV